MDTKKVMRLLVDRSIWETDWLINAAIHLWKKFDSLTKSIKRFCVKKQNKTATWNCYNSFTVILKPIEGILQTPLAWYENVPKPVPINNVFSTFPTTLANNTTSNDVLLFGAKTT